MGGPLDAAREHVQRASDAAGGTVREQLQSVDEGLMELTGGNETRDEEPRDDRLAELADKLDGLADRVDGTTRREVASARDHVRSAIDE